jgi:ADP-ribose pyrophosphatase YjhB (NUDIX family)
VATHCSNCGSALGSEPPTTCAACGAEHWRNAKPCGGALLVHDGRLLLARRAIEPWRGRWDIPGGFCDEREHPRDAAARELREETGLQGRPVRFLGIWVDDYENGDVCMNVYYVMEPVGETEPSGGSAEISELRWFAPDELPLDDISFPAHCRDVLAAWRDGEAPA